MKMTKRLACVLMALVLVALSGITVTASADIWVGDFRLSNDQQILVQYAGTDASPVIPSTVKTIGAAAFKDNEDMTSITIPSTVTSIRDRAFLNCKNLQTVTMPNTISTIPAYAFAYCSSLNTINIPRSVTSIGAYAFAYSPNLKNLIGPDAQNVGPYTYYPVPSYVTSIGDNAFTGCSALTIQCFKGSAMETYCINNKLQYVSVEAMIYGLKAGQTQYLTVYKGGTVQLSVTTDPSFIDKSRLGWSSSDVSIATVDENGLVTGRNTPGMVVITCYSPDQLDVYIEIPVIILDSRLTWQEWPAGSGNWYYCTGTGYATGWKQIGNDWYYFSPVGIMQTGWQVISGKTYFFRADGRMVSGWYNSAGNIWYYFQNGVMVTGWKKINNYWYYFETAAGAAQGQMYINGTYTISGKNYAFDANGRLFSAGWKQVGGNWYYFAYDGVVTTGWLKYQNKWYYLAPGTGAMVTGWNQIGGIWYYFYNTGAMATGWVKSGSDWYFFNNSGAMAVGWLKNNKKWYYLKVPNGNMAVNEWLFDGGYWYYFTGSGAMATGTHVIGGTTYKFDGNGHLIP